MSPSQTSSNSLILSTGNGKMPISAGSKDKNNAEPKTNWVQRHDGRGDRT